MLGTMTLSVHLSVGLSVSSGLLVQHRPVWEKYVK